MRWYRWLLLLAGAVMLAAPALLLSPFPVEKETRPALTNLQQLHALAASFKASEVRDDKLIAIILFATIGSERSGSLAALAERVAEHASDDLQRIQQYHQQQYQ